MQVGGGVARTPIFDRHIASLQRDEAHTLKQQRLAREETEHEAARKGKGKGKDQNKGAEEGGQ